MRNLLALIGLAVVLFFGLGWYFGWYTLTVESEGDGRKRIQFDVDTNKIGEDGQQFKNKVGTLLQNGERAAPKPGDEDFIGPTMPQTSNTNSPNGNGSESAMP